MAAQAALGYFIWAKWFVIALTGEGASRRFWLLASLHHLTWIPLTLYLYKQDRLSFSLAMFAYSIVVLNACIPAAVVVGGPRDNGVATEGVNDREIDG